MAEKTIPQIPLTIVGATENVPVALSGYGKDCVAEGGFYSYLARPDKGKGLLIHEHHGAFGAWKAAKGDAPPANAALAEPANAVSGKQAVALIQAFQKSIPKSTPSAALLKGAWKGWIACTPHGPQITLVRTIADGTVLAISSDPEKGTWDWAVRIIRSARADVFTAAAGTKGKVLQGKGFKWFTAAFNAAITEAMGLVSDACVVKEIHRKASLSPQAKAAAEARQVAKGKKPTAPLTTSEAKAEKKAEAKVQAAGPKAKVNVAGKLGVKAGKAAAKEEKKAAKDKDKAKAKKDKAPRARKTAAKGQSGLKGKFLLIEKNGPKALAGKAVFVKDVAANAKGDFTPANGGAKLTVVFPSAKGVGEVGILEYKDGKRVFKVGGKSQFQAAFVAIGLKADKTWSASGVEAMKAGLAAHTSLKEKGIKVPPRAESALKVAQKAADKAAKKKERDAKKKQAEKAKKARAATRKAKAKDKAKVKKSSKIEGVPVPGGFKKSRSGDGFLSVSNKGGQLAVLPTRGGWIGEWRRGAKSKRSKVVETAEVAANTIKAIKETELAGKPKPAPKPKTERKPRTPKNGNGEKAAPPAAPPAAPESVNLAELQASAAAAGVDMDALFSELGLT
jgi:histone H1/5